MTEPSAAGASAGTAPGVVLRRHQKEALERLSEHWRARDRAWVVLPPGAGKTMVGLESARRMLRSSEGDVAEGRGDVAEGRGDVVEGGAARDAVDHVVVLGPNTAIQSQWVRAARDHGLDASHHRDLRSPVTVLTYQSIALFDADAEVDDDAHEWPLMARLHPRGLEVVRRIRDSGRVLVVLDECHHLLEVWGRLLGEILAELPGARVLGLTATPPDALTAEQSALVDELFGHVVYETSTPAVVREGDLAPFAELAWLCSPTTAEEDWLAEQAERFTTLTTRLCDPAWGSTPFLSWVDRRFVDTDRVAWLDLVRQWPAETSAALRLHHVGLLRRPEGARLGEQDRRPPTADDWMVLVTDWAGHCVSGSDDPDDLEVVAEIRHTLPAIGYQWTARGIRRGRSPVDRVLARSAAKGIAAARIAVAEHRALGDRMRTLILCDHERASATVPVGLDGVLDAQAGSAYGVLDGLLAEPDVAVLAPLLVTGRSVVGAEKTLGALRDAIAEAAPDLAASLRISPDPDLPGAGRLEGGWTSRRWVPFVTRFFESGGTQVLVGTRGLLGEGWNARRITGLIDLTSVTTSTAVVQTRGRALRTDPAWPDKVAINWTVACVSDAHPQGNADWDRLVRKHTGYYAVDPDGEITDGVAHLDPLFSPFAAPAESDFDASNRRALTRAADRAGIRESWQVGTPYEDHTARTLRILPTRAFGVPEAGGASAGRRLLAEPAAVVPREDGLEVRGTQAPEAPARAPRRPLPDRLGRRALAVLGWAAAFVLGGALPAEVFNELVAHVVALGVLGAAGVQGFRSWQRWREHRRLGTAYAHQVLALAARPPGLGQFASAVADALHAAGRTAVGSDAVRVLIDADGEYRCHLADATDTEAALFAAVLDEAIGPILLPRYVVPRYVVDGDVPPDRARLTAAREGILPADGVVWHPVPTALGRKKSDAESYARALDRWVGCGKPLYTGSPEGAGVLAAQQGSDPFAVTTVMRRHWT